MTGRLPRLAAPTVMAANEGQRLRSDTVVADGVVVTYFTAGEARDGEEPIVLAHGLGGSTAADFSFLMPMLARRHLVVSIDFAEPASPGELLSLDHLESQLEAVIGRLDVGRRFALLGYSLGAVVSAALAARVDNIANLILAGGWMSPSAKLRLHSKIWRRLREEGSAAIGDYLLSCRHSDSYLAQRTAGEFAPPTAGMSGTRFMEQQLKLVEALDITELLPRIGATTLVVGCTEDGIATEQQSKGLFGAIRNARYVAVNSGHALLAERPTELLGLMESFLAAPLRHEAGTIIPTVRP